MIDNPNKYDTLIPLVREADFLYQHDPLVCEDRHTVNLTNRRGRVFLLEVKMIAMSKLTYNQRYRGKLKKERPWIIHYLYAYGRCKNKTHRYFKRGIRCFLTPEDAKYLWFRDEAWLLNKPSIDRLNGQKNYSRDNCAFIELHKNQSQKSYYPKGVIRLKRRKAVIQLSLDRKIIKKFSSISEAGKECGINIGNISSCLKEKSKTSGGYIWIYAS